MATPKTTKQITVLYTADGREDLQKLEEQLQPLLQNKQIDHSVLIEITDPQNPEADLSVDRLAGSRMAVLLVSRDLAPLRDRLVQRLREVQKTQPDLILTEVLVGVSDFHAGVVSLPSNLKAVRDWTDPAEAWVQVRKDLQGILPGPDSPAGIKKGLLWAMGVLLLLVVLFIAGRHLFPPSEEKPVAQFTFDPADCPAPCTVQFTNQSQGAATYHWSFGDGNESGEASPRHTYTRPGTYQVVLIASSGNDRTYRRQETVTVYDEGYDAPVLAFESTEFDFGKLQAGDVIAHTFSFTSKGGTPLNIREVRSEAGCTVLSWPRSPLPEGAQGDIVVQFNSETREGPQNCRITVEANTLPPEQVLTITGTVEKPAPPPPSAPVARFDIEGDGGTAPCEVTFRNNSRNATAYSWNFGDGQTSSAQSPRHRYTSPGTYTVELKATGSGGSDYLRKTVTLHAPPKAVMRFDEVRHNFGTVTAGQAVNHTFDFRNTGNANLVLSDVSAPADCEITSWPRQAIAPSGSGKIKVTFRGTRAGRHERRITVTANTSPAEAVLILTGILEEEKQAKITFTETSFDFGTVTEGQPVNHTFIFQNTGNADLVLSNVTAQTGCTVTSWPRGSRIAPNEGGKIKVAFNSSGRTGTQSRQITVTANTDPTQTTLTLKGKVKAASPPAAAWGWKRVTQMNLDDAHNFLNGKGAYSSKIDRTEIANGAGSASDLIIFYQSKGGPGWGWKRVTQMNLDDAHNFLNGAGAYSRKIKDAEIVALQSGSSIDLILFYQSGGTQNWGWKRVTNLNTDDALNFLNGTGAYSGGIKNVEIVAIQKGSRTDLILFYQKGSAGKWRYDKFRNETEVKNFLSGPGAGKEVEVVGAEGIYLVFYR